MNETANTDSDSVTSRELRDRVETFKRFLQQRGERSARRHRTFIVVGALLFVFSLVSLTYLTTMAFQLDANALTQVGRLELERQLPGGRANLAGYLRGESPSVVRHALRSLLGTLPSLRASLEKGFEARFRAITVQGEEEFRTEMRAALRKSKARLDREFPGLSEAERFEKMLAQVTSDFDQNVDSILAVLYPRYVAEIDRVHGFLKGLHDTDDAKLTSRERTQKELIQTLLRLIIVEQSGVVAGGSL